MDARLIDTWFTPVGGRLAAPRQACGALAHLFVERFGADNPDVEHAIRHLQLAIWSSDQAQDTLAALEKLEPTPEPDPLADLREQVEALTPEQKQWLLGLPAPAEDEVPTPGPAVVITAAIFPDARV